VVWKKLPNLASPPRPPPRPKREICESFFFFGICAKLCTQKKVAQNPTKSLNIFGKTKLSFIFKRTTLGSSWENFFIIFWSFEWQELGGVFYNIMFLFFDSQLNYAWSILVEGHQFWLQSVTINTVIHLPKSSMQYSFEAFFIGFNYLIRQAFIGNLWPFVLCFLI
jgi:hypothetical protein